jgi:nicotinamide phosphoribosyltransferase
MLDYLLYAMQEAGFSADNIAFGSGGGLLQQLNRDTLKFAFKCAAVVVDGQEREVFKNPVTDHGKRSKSGRMKLVKAEGPHGPTLETVRLDQPGDDQLVEVFRDGRITKDWSFAEIRQRAKT